LGKGGGGPDGEEEKDIPCLKNGWKVGERRKSKGLQLGKKKMKIRGVKEKRFAYFDRKRKEGT